MYRVVENVDERKLLANEVFPVDFFFEETICQSFFLVFLPPIFSTRWICNYIIVTTTYVKNVIV